jgi:predicted kinase
MIESRNNMQKFDNLAHPILILIRGLPGSGKSFVANELAKQIGDEKVVLLDPDAIDFESESYKENSAKETAEGTDPKLLPYRFLRSKAYKGIEENKVIIWNQPFTNLEIFSKMIGRLEEHAKHHDKKLKILVVEVDIDHETAKSRVDERKKSGGHGPSEQTFDRFSREYSSAAAQGYTIIDVHGKNHVQESVERIINALN